MLTSLVTIVNGGTSKDSKRRKTESNQKENWISDGRMCEICFKKPENKSHKDIIDPTLKLQVPYPKAPLHIPKYKILYEKVKSKYPDTLKPPSKN